MKAITKIKNKKLGRWAKTGRKDVSGQGIKDKKGKLYEITFRDVTIKGLPKTKGAEIAKLDSVEAKDIGYDFLQHKLIKTTEDKNEDRFKAEKLNFNFYRRELLRCTSERAAWGDRSATMKAALNAIKNKKTPSDLTLKKSEIMAIQKALENYKAVDEHFKLAGEHSRNLLASIDYAGKLYREKKRSKAAIKLGWTSEKRRSYSPHADIFIKYLLLMANRKPSRESRIEAIKILKKILAERTGTNVGDDAVIKSLQRTRASVEKIHSDFPHVILPGENYI
jgi:hypothetical protein